MLFSFLSIMDLLNFESHLFRYINRISSETRRCSNIEDSLKLSFQHCYRLDILTIESVEVRLTGLGNHCDQVALKVHTSCSI